MTTTETAKKKERKARAHQKPTKDAAQTKVAPSVDAVQVTEGDTSKGEDGIVGSVARAQKDNALPISRTPGPTKILEQSSQDLLLLSFDQALRKAQSHRSHTLLNLFHAHFAETGDAEGSLSLARKQLGLERGL